MLQNKLVGGLSIFCQHIILKVKNEHSNFIFFINVHFTIQWCQVINCTSGNDNTKFKRAITWQLTHETIY